MVVAVVEVDVILKPTPRSMPMVFLNTANLISMGSALVLAVPMVDVVLEGTTSFSVVPMDCVGNNAQSWRQGRIQWMLVLLHRLPMIDHNRSGSTRPPIIGVALVVMVSMDSAITIKGAPMIEMRVVIDQSMPEMITQMYLSNVIRTPISIGIATEQG